MRARSVVQIRRALARGRAAELRARIRELRDAIKAARVARREQVTAIRHQCATARRKLKSACDRRKEEAKARGAAAIEAARDELAPTASKLENTRDELRTKRRGPSIAERREEADHAVEANLEPELVEVWRRVRSHIRGSKRRSRTEAFLEWVHDHPDDVVRIRTEAAERDLQRLIAEHEAAEREAYELRKARPRARRPRRRAPLAVGEPDPIYVIEDVPF